MGDDEVERFINALIGELGALDLPELVERFVWFSNLYPGPKMFDAEERGVVFAVTLSSLMDREGPSLWVIREEESPPPFVL